MRAAVFVLTSLGALACGARTGFVDDRRDRQPDHPLPVVDSGVPVDVGTSCPGADEDTPFTRCTDVGGPRGCCGGRSASSHGSVNYRFEDGHVVSEDCGTRGCGWASDLNQYRCGATSPEPATRFSCGATLETVAACEGLRCGTSSDETFRCGLNGLRCQVGRQICFVPGGFPDDPKADPKLTQCVTSPPSCFHQDPCSCVVDHLLTPVWCYELGNTSVIFGPAN